MGKKYDRKNMRTKVIDLPGVFEKLNRLRHKILENERVNMQKPEFWASVWND